MDNGCKRNTYSVAQEDYDVLDLWAISRMANPTGSS